MSRIANISLVQLEYLVALDKHRHFIRAAEACYVTQPTLSMQIKKLESELDVKLFDRSRQPIIPTDVGRLVVDQAKKILLETTRVDGILQEYKGTVIGDLYIGIIPTISPYLMPYLISNISKMYPGIRLHVKELLTEDILSNLAKDQLDLGILSTPLNMDGIVETPLFFEKFLVYMNPEHVAFHKSAISAYDLLEDKLWLLSEGNCFRNQSINLCSLGDQDLQQSSFDYESGSLETLMRIVDMEGGATIIPEWASLDASAEKRARMRFTDEEDMVREVGMIYSRNFAKARLIEALEEVIKTCVPEALKENEGKQVVDIMVN